VIAKTATAIVERLHRSIAHRDQARLPQHPHPQGGDRQPHNRSERAGESLQHRPSIRKNRQERQQQ
jgi:hypothetical protein